MEERYVTIDPDGDVYIGLYEPADINVTASQAGALLITLDIGMWRIYEVNIEGKWYIKAARLW